MAKEHLAVNQLSVSFNVDGHYHKAIRDVCFKVDKGETLALLGESGCGKSLTSLAIMQLLPNNAKAHQTSQVSFLDKSLMDLPESALRQIRGRKIAVIFQEPMTSLNPVLTIGQQLKEVLRKDKTLSAQSIKETMVDLLTKVELPDPKRHINQYPHQLSGGQKQRVMIAIAIAGKPDLLIADEPTTALDVTIQAQILNLLKNLQQELSMAMLLITHDLQVVKKMADNVAVMYAGEIVEYCSQSAFFADAKHPYSQRLLGCLPSVKKRCVKLDNIDGVVPLITETVMGCRFRARCHVAFDSCQQEVALTALTDNHLVRCCHYHQGSCLPDVRTETKTFSYEAPLVGEKLLQVRNLKVHYPIQKGILKRQVGVVKAVDGVSFDMFEGETLALVGESGCGKTTLSRTLLKLLPRTSGEVEFRGKSIDDSLADLRKDVQIIFQDPFSSMNPRMLVEDIICEGLYARGENSKGESLDKRLKTLLSQVGLPRNSGPRYPHQFSGGQRQRICIARALALSPKLIICDEPTSALDISVQAQILNLLRELQSSLGVSYLFISHDISVVSYLASRVMVMKAGKIVEMGETEPLLRSPTHPYTQTLLGATEGS